MDFTNYLKSTAQEINQEIASFLDNNNRIVALLSPKLKPLNKNFEKACEGGKRLRGTLVKLGYEMVGRKSGEILKAAVAFEIFQTAILAHDDIIDQSPLRRGQPTLWKSLGGGHYGISQTICLGDIGFFLAYKLIAESNFPDKEKNLGIQFFTNSMLQTAWGEVLDVELPSLKKQPLEKDALTIFKLKTAQYTLVGPLQLGAILGGGSSKLLADIQSFGEDLGIAFQIQDDILGVFGDEQTLGKSVTSDIEEGKVTLLILKALKNASSKQKKILNKYYGKGKIGKRELEQIRQVFIDSGALTYSQQKAGTLVNEAKKIIPLLTMNNEQRTILSEMADFLVRREK